MTDVGNANISEIDDGPYYRVQLSWIPRVGDHIDLHSLKDASDGHQAAHYYEVTQVVHNLLDVTDAEPNGSHFVTVHVRPIAKPAEGRVGKTTAH